MKNKLENNTILEVKDHSVSEELFQLKENKTFGFLETTPQPSVENLPKYYESEDYISHTDAKRSLFEKVYHQIRSISLKRKLRLINHYLRTQQQTFRPARELLDVGCGTGDFLKVAKKNGWSITGIEPNIEARKIANKKTNGVVLEKLEDYKNQSIKFDVITLWHVLEHLPDLENQIKTLQSLLQEKGTLIVAVPNHKSYDAKYYKKFWAAYDVPRHLWHFNQESISKLFGSINMKVVKTKPMIFDAYYVSLLSEKYKNGKMKLVSASWQGFRSNLKAKHSGEYSSLIYVIKND